MAPTMWSLLVIVNLLTISMVRAAIDNNSIDDQRIKDDTIAGNDDIYIDFSKYGEAIFGQPNPETGSILAAVSDGSNATQNPEELGTYLEGDILIPVSPVHRNGLLTHSTRWPGGVVPYEIKGSFNSQQMSVIANAFNEYHTKTCLRFRQRTSKDRDYISITSDSTGCWSSVGRLGGRQSVNLQTPNCFRTYGTTIHELMHAIGFFHEQNRHERDNYVRVMTENIKKSMMMNFEKSSPKTSYSYGVQYDYASVMHYSPTSFTVNGKPTLIALHNTKEAQLMGQRRGFSKGDIRKINAMYKCR